MDIDGEPRGDPPAIGCDEYWSGSLTGPIKAAILVSYTNVAVGFGVDFQALIDGRLSASSWDFGDGVVVSNRPWVSHVWLEPGAYQVELRAYNESYPQGIGVSVELRVTDQPVHYVSPISTNPVPPYSSWATAATNIQNAIDAATLPGALVLVTNGIYNTDARDMYGMNNRVVVTNALTVRSVNGPTATSIVGSGPNGPGAVRCVYLGNAAVLAGFTVTNGATQTSGDYSRNRSGGGVWCESASGVISNCVLTGNSATRGGGAHSGRLYNCTLAANSASQSGGGAYFAALNDCTLRGNSSYEGAGASASTLNNCMLTGNSAFYGGGASYGTLNNCTLAGNSASDRGGGASYGTLNNCVVYYNAAPTGANHFAVTLNYSCTTPLPAGIGNFTNAPLFMDTNAWRNLRLQASSPCINAGNNAYLSGLTDLDGSQRVSGGTVDIGTYEFRSPTSIISYAWLQQYRLRTDGSTDFVDTDRDGLDNWQEWVAGTNPTNAASVLRMLSATNDPIGITVTWSSVNNRNYSLERATELAASPAFSTIVTNIEGESDTTSYTDAAATAFGSFFYRVRVEP